MRKLKLQVQITVDGFVTGPNGDMDWMTPLSDDQAAAFINDLTDNSDTILLGRKMTEGFVNYWEGVVNSGPDNPEFSFAQKMVNTPKVVFSQTFTESVWKNTTIARGDLTDEVNRLKSLPGKDIIVYGGATFVSSLIQHGLIDEYYLVINPVVVGRGRPIFALLNHYQHLTLVNTASFASGEVVLHYKLNK